MEENEIRILDSGLLTEGEEEILKKEKKNKKLHSYVLITASFFILMISILFSEIGYSLIKTDGILYQSNFLKFIDSESDFKEVLSRRLMQSFLCVGETHEIDKTATENTDEPQKDEIEAVLPIETEAQTSFETEINISVETESEKTYPVVSLDLSQNQLGENYIVNETGYSPDIAMLRETKDGFESLKIEDKNLPSVLIIHTHGTESYLEEGKDHYKESEGDISRTDDKEKNMVRIGRVMAEVLNSAGIKTLHCEILHDRESYQDSYIRSSESIKSYLAKYPSIKYVIDIHRDAILKSDGSLVKATTEIDNKSTAQVMTVIGSDYKGANFPNWERNLSVALKLKKILDEEDDTLSRPVYLRGAAYNQQYAPCSLLLEIGTSGNTLEEAENVAVIVAEALTKLINDLSCKH